MFYVITLLPDQIAWLSPLEHNFPAKTNKINPGHQISAAVNAGQPQGLP